MGFIFLTLAIYQAEAAWWGERGGSNSPMSASAQQGERWFMVSLPFHITLFLSCLFPSLPAVVCILSPLPVLSSILTYSIKLPSFSHLLSLTPCGSFLHLILHPLFPLLHLPLFPFLIFFLSFISPLYFRTLGTMAPFTSPRWQPSTWGTTVAMPMAMKTCIRHMCCRWMVSSGSFLT